MDLREILLPCPLRVALEASTLTATTRLGRIVRRSPLLRLQGDERLIALTRAGNDRAFEALVERYQARLGAFCRGMLGSAEDAEDILQEVFVAAHAAILADNRHINVRPWLYRIARNRCLNHLRKPVAEGQDSMDVHPHENGVSVAERVQKREDFRALIADVQELPETQRTALLLRELDALSYEEIAAAMDTTVPAVKSLLVRARMSLAECSQARHLTCDEVNLELAEAAEGLRKVSGPVRVHLRRCERCRQYREELRRSERSLAALAPVGPFGALMHVLGSKLGIGAGTGTAGGTAVGGATAASSGGAMGVAAGGAITAIGGKAVAGFASVALLTAGAVEVNHLYREKREPATPPAASAQANLPHKSSPAGATGSWAPGTTPYETRTMRTTRAKQPAAPASANQNAPETSTAPEAATTPATAGTAPVAPTQTAPSTETPATPPATSAPPATSDTAVTGSGENGGGVAGPGAGDSGVVPPADPPPEEEPPAEDPPPPTSDKFPPAWISGAPGTGSISAPPVQAEHEPAEDQTGGTPAAE